MSGDLNTEQRKMSGKKRGMTFRFRGDGVLGLNKPTDTRLMNVNKYVR